MHWCHSFAMSGYTLHQLLSFLELLASGLFCGFFIAVISKALTRMMPSAISPLSLLSKSWMTTFAALGLSLTMLKTQWGLWRHKCVTIYRKVIYQSGLADERKQWP